MLHNVQAVLAVWAERESPAAMESMVLKDPMAPMVSLLSLLVYVSVGHMCCVCRHVYCTHIRISMNAGVHGCGTTTAGMKKQSTGRKCVSP